MPTLSIRSVDACDISLGARIMETLTYFSSHSRQVDVATWVLVLPIDKENLYRLLRGWYIYIYVEFLASHFSDLSCCISKFTSWAIIEELSIHRWVCIFLISWGQKMHVKNCYVDLLSWYEFWFAIICISMNIISDLSTTIRQFYRRFRFIATKWVNAGEFFFFFKYNDNGMIQALMCLC